MLQRIEDRLGITPAGVVLASLVLPGFALGRALGSAPVFLLVYGAILILGLSRVLARRRLDLVAERSTLPTRLRAEQSIDVQLSITSSRRLSTLVFEEVLPDGPVQVPVSSLPAGESLEHGYRFTARRRGVFEIGPLVAQWTDPFGLTRRRVVIAPAQTLIVHPNTESLQDRITSREWEDPPIRPPQSKPWPSGFEFYGMRDYVNGDDPRRIIWTASAKTDDRYLVRESEQGITDRVVLLLDTARDHHTDQTLEDAIRVVASLGVKHLADGFSVSLEANASRLAANLRGPGARIPLLDQLAALAVESAPLTTSLDRLFLDRQRNTHNVLVTPHLSEQAARRCRVLLERGSALQLVLVLTDDVDAAMVHRAATLRCNVVEVRPGASLRLTFSRMVGAGR